MTSKFVAVIITTPRRFIGGLLTFLTSAINGGKKAVAI
jgi:hypothetical protein